MGYVDKIKLVEQKYLAKKLPEFQVGDTVKAGKSILAQFGEE